MAINLFLLKNKANYSSCLHTYIRLLVYSINSTIFELVESRLTDSWNSFLLSFGKYLQCGGLKNYNLSI